MTTERYQELLGLLLEGELDSDRAAELARALNESVALRDDLRSHLVLWDAWAQHLSPERSAGAFVQSWKTRLRSLEEDAGAFAGAVTAGIKAEQQKEQGRICPIPDAQTGVNPSPGSIVAWISSIIFKARRSSALAAVSVVFVVFALFYVVTTRTSHAITLKGDAICTSCFLHESHEHNPALRVMNDARTNIVYLEHNKVVDGIQGRFCGGPTPATAQGKSRTEGKRTLFNAVKIEFPEAPSRESTNKNDRILFPI